MYIQGFYTCVSSVVIVFLLLYILNLPCPRKNQIQEAATQPLQWSRAVHFFATKHKTRKTQTHIHKRGVCGEKVMQVLTQEFNHLVFDLCVCVFFGCLVFACFSFLGLVISFSFSSFFLLAFVFIQSFPTV